MSQSGKRPGACLPLLMVTPVTQAPKYLPACPRRRLSHHRGHRQVPSEPASAVPSLQSSVSCSNLSHLSCFPTSHPASAYLKFPPRSYPGSPPSELSRFPPSVPLEPFLLRETERDAWRWMLHLVALGVPKLPRGIPNGSGTLEKADFWGAGPRPMRGKSLCPSWQRGPAPGSESWPVLTCLAMQPMPSTF